MKNIIFITTMLTVICASQVGANHIPDVNCLMQSYDDRADFENFEDLINHLYDGQGAHLWVALERLNAQLNKKQDFGLAGCHGEKRCYFFSDPTRLVECYYNSESKKLEIIVHDNELFEHFLLQTRFNISKEIYRHSFDLANRFFAGCLSQDDLRLTVKGSFKVEVVYDDDDEYVEYIEIEEPVIEPVLVVWENGNPIYKEPFFQGLK